LEPDAATEAQIQELKALRPAVNAKFKELDPGAALKLIMNAVYEVNPVIPNIQDKLTTCRPTDICRKASHGSKLELASPKTEPKSIVQFITAQKLFALSVFFYNLTCLRRQHSYSI
jgi:hypothetical protein